MTLPAGTQLGRYAIRSLLGAGGMGEVYLAHDPQLNRAVAVKILPPAPAAGEERMRRFTQEARAAAALNHPSIAHIYEIGQSNDTHFIAMEYVDGMSLRQRMQAGPMPVPEAVEIAVQVTSALAAAHEASVVHRDIKPENIMLSGRDHLVKVLDFGLAKLIDNRPVSSDTAAATRAMALTEAGRVMGTARYMSPEQARGQDTDARTDIWSVGVLLFEMVAGRPPFDGETTSDVIASTLRADPPRLSDCAAGVPARLEEIVARALEKNRDERYQTAPDLLVDLKELKKQLDFGRAAGVSNEAGARSVSSAEYIRAGVRNHRTGLAGAFVLLLAAGGLGAWYRSAHSHQIDSIAVLPFANDTGVAGNDYLADGMTESLIGTLSQIPTLNVKARSSVFRYKGREADAKTIRRELKVGAFLTGRLVQRGNEVTLYIDLVDAGTENVLWKRTYIRGMSDLATMQGDVGRDVSGKLRPKLSGADEQRVTKNHTANATAYQEYLKGRFHTLQYTPEGHRSAVEHFNEAIRLDPNYSLAWAGLADAYTAAAEWLLPPREALAKARAAAEKALMLDEGLAEGHAALGHVLVHQLDPAADRELKRALELNPNSVEARLWYGEYFIVDHNQARAIAVLKQAQELDPLSPVVGQFTVFVYFLGGQLDAALQAAEQVIDIDPNDPNSRGYLAMVYAAQGKHAEAIQILEELRKQLPTSQMLGELGMEYALTGRRDDALKTIDAINELSKEQYVSPYDIAVVNAALGRKDLAFQWLEKARADQSEYMGWLHFDQRFNSLRSDPRLADLLRRIGNTGT